MAAAREEELTAAERELKAAYARSWADAQAALGDPEFRAYLEASIERARNSTAPRLTGEEFLALTE